MTAPLQDAQGRGIRYLRLSVTDRCNFRCVYCSPSEWSGRADLLNAAELERLTRIFAALGVVRVRLTGGEPTARKDLVEITERLARVPGISELCLTTNGVRLPELAGPLYDAGLRRLNVSLDTVDAAAFRLLSGERGEAADVIAGIVAARVAGFSDLVVNAVVLAGVNDKPSQLAALVETAWQLGATPRFIELMPFSGGTLVPTDVVLARLALAGIELQPEVDKTSTPPRGPSVYYQHNRGSVGFISPITKNFCGGCNRVRVAANGDLRACLGGREQVPLRTMLRDGASDGAIAVAIRAALMLKLERHDMDAPRGRLLPMMGIGG